MTALLLDIPTDLTNRPTETAADPQAGLPVATERVAGAAFCVDLDPGLLSFTRRRIAEHFAVADDQVDVMITFRTAAAEPPAVPGAGQPARHPLTTTHSFGNRHGSALDADLCRARRRA